MTSEERIELAVGAILSMEDKTTDAEFVEALCRALACGIAETRGEIEWNAAVDALSKQIMVYLLSCVDTEVAQ